MKRGGEQTRADPWRVVMNGIDNAEPVRDGGDAATRDDCGCVGEAARRGGCFRDGEAARVRGGDMLYLTTVMQRAERMFRCMFRWATWWQNPGRDVW